MKRIIFIFVVVLAMLSCANAQWNGCKAGFCNQQQVSATYQGPIDIAGSAKLWVGLRAASAADRGNKLINICDPTNTTCVDWSSDVSTGKLVATLVGAADCTLVNTCTIKTWYDRSGANNCSAATCDLIQLTAASRPTLTWNCNNSLPCVVFTGTQIMQAAGTFTALSQPFSTSAVSNRAAVSGTATSLFFNSIAQAGFAGTANTARLFAGSGASVGNVSDTFFHAFQEVFNGASSTLLCGGSQGTACSNAGVSTTVNPGTGSVGGAAISMNNGLTGPTYQMTELGIWAADNTSVRSSLNSNQLAFWGPF